MCDINFVGINKEIEITIRQDSYEEEICKQHYTTYEKFIKNLDKITPNIIQAILEYQNEHYNDTDYTESFKYFENEKDVLDNIELLEMFLQIEPFGIVKESELYKEAIKNDDEERCVVLIFGAEWVNDDYRLLDVAIVNEKVVYVTEESISH